MILYVHLYVLTICIMYIICTVDCISCIFIFFFFLETTLLNCAIYMYIYIYIQTLKIMHTSALCYTVFHRFNVFYVYTIEHYILLNYVYVCINFSCRLPIMLPYVTHICLFMSFSHVFP